MDDCIRLLSQIYGEKCRVIKNQGDYDYMIRLRYGTPTDSIYVQISIPTDRTIDVDVRVSGGPDNVHADLQAYLHQNGSKQVDNVSEMVLNLFKSADNWLAENTAFKDLCKLVPQAKKSLKPKVTKLSRETERDTAQDGPQKKAGMKTAEDVIKRLKWDESLPADQFTVGYLDRFIGVVEKPFTAFNWEDLVNAEITDLAIPQHRIQYFCYKKVKVWDKNDRLDLVFNSVRAGPTIYDVMKQQDRMVGGTVEVNEDKSCSENEPLVGDAEQVCSLSSEPSGADAETGVPKGVRPDYFLAVPIDDPTLRGRVHMVQGSFRSQFPKVVKTFLDLDHLHVTVALFSTGQFPNGAENIANALTIENDRLKKLFSQIQFRGLNLLADRVLCSFPDESFKENILAPLREIFNKYNVTFYMPSVPHLTIAKLNLAKDPENSESVQNLVHSSRFNGTQILNRFVLRPVGVKTSQEFVFNLE